MTLDEIAKNAGVRSCDIRYIESGGGVKHLQVSFDGLEWKSFMVWTSPMTLDEVLHVMEGIKSLQYLMVHKDLDGADND